MKTKNKDLKNAVALLVFIAVFGAGTAQAAITITTFGSSAVADGNTSWVYNSDTSTITGNSSLGDLIYNADGTGSWNLTSEAASLSLLQISLTGYVTTNPTGSFAVTLADNTNKEAKFTFAWSSFGTTSSTANTVTVGVDTFNAGFNLANIVNWNLVSGGSGLSTSATFSQMTAVPEPSTGALMMIGAAGLVALRRLRKV